jgi:hypothetical protein
MFRLVQIRHTSLTPESLSESCRIGTSVGDVPDGLLADRLSLTQTLSKTHTPLGSYELRDHTPYDSFLEMLEFAFPKAPLRRSTMCDDLGVINKRVHTAFTRVKLHETPRARMQQPLSDTRPTGTESPILSTYTRDQRPDPRHRRRSPHHQRPETRDQRPETRDLTGAAHLARSRSPSRARAHAVAA